MTQEEEEEGFYKFLPANTADRLCTGSHTETVKKQGQHTQTPMPCPDALRIVTLVPKKEP